jgi:hypothetical protein
MEDQVPTEQLKKPLESCSRIFESTLASVEMAEDTALEIAQAAGFRGDELEKVGLASAKLSRMPSFTATDSILQRR